MNDPASWWKWALLPVGLYLACGVGTILVLSQTPYAKDPLWAKLVAWWLYLLLWWLYL